MASSMIDNLANLKDLNKEERNFKKKARDNQNKQQNEEIDLGLF